MNSVDSGSGSDSLGTDDKFVNHVYVANHAISNNKHKRNLIPFVKRHDYTIVTNDYAAHPETAGDEEIRERLAETHEEGIDVWLGAGLLPGGRGGTRDDVSWSDQELLDDEEKMEQFLAAHRETARTYREFYPGGKLILWHETPLMGNWTGDTHEEKAQSVVDYGPEIFARQKEAIKSVSTDLDVGIFPHWTVMPEPEYTKFSICEPLFTSLKELDALPDFTYVDAYRGYYEWAAGYEPTNEMIASIVSNIKEHTEGRPVYYLGEAHTINNNYTPSKQAIFGNLQTALESGVESAGWYIRTAYRQTEPRCFNPFLPNVGEPADENEFSSMTGSRDRLLWANLLLLERRTDFDPAEKFDLWLSGHDFAYYEHALSLKTDDGHWEFIGDFSGYVDGDNPYSGEERDRSVCFHALDRERFLTDGSLNVRVDSDGEATLDTIHVLPYLDTSHYQSEPDATTLVDADALADYSLGHWRDAESLTAGETTTLEVAIGEEPPPLTSLVYPDQHEEFERMRAIEAEVPLSATFDLWVYGDGVAGGDLEVILNEETIAEYADPQPADTFEEGHRQAVVYRGLERDAFFTEHAGGHYLDVRVAAPDATVYGVYAMPYHGATNFTPDAEAARIVTREYTDAAGQIDTFCLGSQTWPYGRSLTDPVDTWLHISNRRAVAKRS